MHPHEKLDVWKKGIDFVVALYNLSSLGNFSVVFMLTGLCQHLEKKGR